MNGGFQQSGMYLLTGYYADKVKLFFSKKLDLVNLIQTKTTSFDVGLFIDLSTTNEPSLNPILKHIAFIIVLRQINTQSYFYFHNVPNLTGMFFMS